MYMADVEGDFADDQSLLLRTLLTIAQRLADTDGRQHERNHSRLPSAPPNALQTVWSFEPGACSCSRFSEAPMNERQVSGAEGNRLNYRSGRDAAPPLYGLNGPSADCPLSDLKREKRTLPSISDAAPSSVKATAGRMRLQKQAGRAGRAPRRLPRGITYGLETSLGSRTLAYSVSNASSCSKLTGLTR